METVDLKKLYLYTSSPEVVWGKSAIQLNASSKKQKQNQANASSNATRR
jgi:hypothetical protein